MLKRLFMVSLLVLCLPLALWATSITEFPFTASPLVDMTQDSSLGMDSYLYSIDDPAGTPVDRYITMQELADTVLSEYIPSWLEGETMQTLSGTTPDVTSGGTGVTNHLWQTNSNGTITDFTDGDDHSEFSDGDWIVVRSDDVSVFDFTDDSTLRRNGNSGLDFTGIASTPFYLTFVYDTTFWICTNLSPGVSGPNTLAVNSVALNAAPDDMADDEYNGEVITGINFGETVAQWGCVFLAADGKVDIADADAAGEFPAIGIAVAGGNDTDAATILTKGIVRNEGWTGLTVGAAIYLGDAGAGAITETAPSTEDDCVQIVGRAVSDSEIYFNFSMHWLLAGE